MFLDQLEWALESSNVGDEGARPPCMDLQIKDNFQSDSWTHADKSESADWGVHCFTVLHTSPFTRSWMQFFVMAPSRPREKRDHVNRKDRAIVVPRKAVPRKKERKKERKKKARIFFLWALLVLADQSPSSPRVEFLSASSYCCVNYIWGCWVTRQSSCRSNRCAGSYPSIRDRLLVGQTVLSLAGPVAHWDIEM